MGARLRNGRWLIAAALPLIGIAAAAQEASQAELDAVSARWKLMEEGKYLAAEEVLRPFAFDAAGRPRPGFVYDQWAQTSGWLTGEPAPKARPADAPPPDADPTPIPADLATRDAIAAIVEQARATRIVILNEDHAVPRDRAFALQVARALRPLGYDVLAVETFNNDPDAARGAAAMQRLAKDGYPRRMTGVYLRDPVFGDFIRQSLALGYRPVAYEIATLGTATTRDAQIAEREQAQADNLVAHALKAYPRSKILVYVGHSHVTEQPQLSDGEAPIRWLGTRLKAMTGIDPLTIDQVTLNANGSGDAALHARLADRAAGRPAMLFQGERPVVLGQYAGLVDLQVLHPRAGRVAGRPDWLVEMNRVATPIPADLLPARGMRLVQAFVAGEGDDAIPVDQVLVTAGEAPPLLMLPGVPVRYAVQDPAQPALAGAGG